MAHDTGNLFRHLVQRERSAAPALAPRLTARFEPTVFAEPASRRADQSPAVTPAAAGSAEPLPVLDELPTNVGAGDVRPGRAPDRPARSQRLATSSEAPADVVQGGEDNGSGDAPGRWPAPGAARDRAKQNAAAAPPHGLLPAHDDVQGSPLLAAIPPPVTFAAATAGVSFRAARLATPNGKPNGTSNGAALPPRDSSNAQSAWPAVATTPGKRPVDGNGDSATLTSAESRQASAHPATATSTEGRSVMRAGLPAVQPEVDRTGTPRIRGALSESSAGAQSAAAAGATTGAYRAYGELSGPPSSVPEHTVHVTIGRIELRPLAAANARAAPARRGTGTPAAPSLADYLQRRGGR